MNMMRRLILWVSVIIPLLFVGAFAQAQTTALTGTLVDSDGTTWFNATVNLSWQPNPSYPNAAYNINGTLLTSTTYAQYLNQSVKTNSSGVFSVTTLDTSKISPTGSYYAITVQSYTSAPSSVLPPVQISGNTLDLSAFINLNLTAPRFAAVAGQYGGAYGYGTNEVSVTPIPGGSFFNVSTATIYVWSCQASGCAWSQQEIGNFCSVGGCAYTGEITLPDITPLGANNPITPITLSSLFNDFSPEVGASYGPTSINGALALASSNGSVTIPANYTGTDSIGANTFNVSIHDRRPFNPTNNPIYQGPSAGPMPPTTIKAADYGVLCNGVHDDTLNLQAAIAAYQTIAGGVALVGQQAMTHGAIELPQGRCLTSNTITMPDYGSIIGSPNGTWWSPLEPWAGSTYVMLQISQSYATANYNNQFTSGVNRQVRGINFWYNYNAHAYTAIQVINPTGHTSGQPYPSTDNNPGDFQLRGVTIADNYFYTLDTAIDLEDCNGCLINNNRISYVRQGIIVKNAYSTVATNNNLLVGSVLYTSTSGATNGIYSTSDARYVCTGGTAPGCIGGTVAESVTASPQGITLSGNTFEDWDIDANIVNCLGFIAYANGFDTGATGLGIVEPTIYLGQIKEAQIWDNFMASNRTDSPVIEIAGLTSTQGTGLNNQDGLWIYDNFIYAYNPSTGAGIQFDAGTVSRRNAHIDGNQFTSLAYGINVLTGLNYSTLNGNYGATLTTALLNFNNSAGFTGTVVRDNTSPQIIPIYTNSSGTGLRVEYNISPAQVTGDFTWTGSGCSISAGAIGNNCATTIAPPSGQPAFLDANYQIKGCSITGASNPATIGFISTPTLGGTVAINEYALSTFAVSGGTIKCDVYHP